MHHISHIEDPETMHRAEAIADDLVGHPEAPPNADKHSYETRGT
jgi:hypothetical protein